MMICFTVVDDRFEAPVGVDGVEEDGDDDCVDDVEE